MAGANGIFYNGVWSCGFDFLPTGSLLVGSPFDVVASPNPAINASFARFSGKGCECVPGIAQLFARSFGVNLSSVIVGFAFQTVALPGTSAQIATLYDTVGGGMQISLGYNNQGQIGMYSAGGFPATNTLGTPVGPSSSAGVIVPSVYVFIEMQVTIGNSGSVVVFVNGKQVLTFSGKTQQTANAFANRMYWGTSPNAGNNHFFDDIYMLDLTGSAPLNAPLGPGRIQTDVPIGGSATPGLNVWTPTNPQGTDFGNCANNPPNVAQYNSSGTVGQRMSLSFPPISNISQVMFMNTWYQVEEDAAGIRTLSPIFRSNGVDQIGPPISLGAAFGYFNQASTLDPNTGNNWAAGTVGAAQSCEIGLQVSS